MQQPEAARRGKAPAGPGTVARAAIQYLMTLPPGTELPSGTLAEAIGHSPDGIGAYLTPSATAGLLNRRKTPNGFALWSLGPNASKEIPPREAPPAGADDERVISTSAAAVPSIFAYAQQRAAAPFSVAISSDGRCTIERHGRVVCELTDEERKLLLRVAASEVAA